MINIYLIKKIKDKNDSFPLCYDSQKEPETPTLFFSVTNRFLPFKSFLRMKDFHVPMNYLH